MANFSVPVVRVPASFVLTAPKVIPVFYKEEHVADARLRDRNYHFEMFQGDLQKGLQDGSLLIKPLFVDRETPGELSTRTYKAIELVPAEMVFPEDDLS
jgi:hypothetical protein